MRIFWLVSLIVFGIGGFAASARATTVFSDVTLGQAGVGGYDLGVFVTGGQFQSTNPSTTTNGNVGFASGVTQSGTSDGTVNGIVYYQVPASLGGDGNFNKNGTFTQTSLAQAMTDVQNASTTAASLAANQTFGNIGNAPLTITPSGMDTVVKVNGNISISNSSNNLTINGTADDYYIINVSGNIVLTNGAITTSGGIPVSHILFNLYGNNAQFTAQTSTSEVGTFLLPFSGDQITTHGCTIDGALIGYNVSMTSGTDLLTNSFVPEPLTMLAFGIGIVGLGGYVRRRCAAKT